MLKPGDRIAAVCTGTSCGSYDDAKAAADYFNEHYRLRVSYEHDVSERLPPEERAKIFLSNLLNEDIKAIWCLRGGEGTADIIPYLHKERNKLIQLKSKPLLGFSDFTPMLNYFANEYGWVVYHSPGLRQFHRAAIGQSSVDQAIQFLMNDQKPFYFQPLNALNSPASALKTIQGKVFGGNLSLMMISFNDIWQPNVKDKILLLEEVNERPHKVARSLKYLNRIGYFSEIKAVILAGFDFLEEQKDDISLLEKSMKRVLKSFADSLSIPVFYCDCVGHGEINFLLPLNHELEFQIQG